MISAREQRKLTSIEMSWSLSQNRYQRISAEVSTEIIFWSSLALAAKHLQLSLVTESIQLIVENPAAFAEIKTAFGDFSFQAQFVVVEFPEKIKRIMLVIFMGHNFVFRMGIFESYRSFDHMVFNFLFLSMVTSQSRSKHGNYMDL